jgi:hypothetical protein
MTERVAGDVVGHLAMLQAEALEEHHRDVDTAVAGGDGATARPIEIRLVEPREVKRRPSVRGGPVAGSIAARV